METEEEIVYQLALVRTEGIGGGYARKLIRAFGSASAVFKANPSQIASAGVPEPVVKAIRQFRGQAPLEAEAGMLAEKNIRVLFLTDPDFPRRLLPIDDAPALLFYRGNADLNAQKVLSVVGTRTADEYGKAMTARLIRQLEPYGVLIVSGLAAGIDASAHSAAMINHLPTVAVLGHGFCDLYPGQHRPMANTIMKNGGLLSAYKYDVRAKPWRFPQRNLLMAGMCDALIVIQTDKSGGSMLTVRHATRFAKRVFAVPGRLMDKRSSGCNWLIEQNTAGLLTSGEQLAAEMGWERSADMSLGQSADMGPERPGVEKDIHAVPASGSSAEEELLALLRSKESLTIDELIDHSRLDASDVAVSLLHLELRGSISSLPGKRYRVV